MAIDLVCGQCQGRLIAELPGTVVACPHCGTHLQVPGESVGKPHTAANAQPAAGGLLTSTLESAEDHPGVSAPPAPGSMVQVDHAMLIEESAAAAMDTPSAIAAISKLPTNAKAVASHVATRDVDLKPPPEPGLPTISPRDTTAPATVSRSVFLIVASYASALTLAFVFLLLQFLYVKTHQLESLPDLVPEIRHGEAALKIAPPDAKVAPGHVLAVGKSRRYGSLKVTPLKITQGTLRFEHALNDPAAQRTPSEPVLKLWLRFENVSRDQRFSPLDSLLLFKRHYQGLGEPDLTNQFLRPVEEGRSEGSLHYVFELSPTSEFRIAGQQLNKVLGPGESLETFIPSEEQIDDLNGDLVWRVQFRKGYHPRTRHGVTTLIDVPFHRNDVKIES